MRYCTLHNQYAIVADARGYKINCKTQITEQRDSVGVKIFLGSKFTQWSFL